MRSCWSGVSGGNESTMVWICSARTVVARWEVAGSVVLGGACVVGAGCVREGGTGAGGSLGSISGAVVVGCAWLALLRVLLLLSRCFESLGLLVRCVSFRRGHSWGCPARFGFACGEAAEYANGRSGISRFRLPCRSQFRWPRIGRWLRGCLL
jgi:hypothetical protein